MDSQADFLPVGGSLLLLREAVANVCRGEGGAERVWCVRDHWDSGSDKKKVFNHLDSKINLAVCSNNFK